MPDHPPDVITIWLFLQLLVDGSSHHGQVLPLQLVMEFLMIVQDWGGWYPRTLISIIVVSIILSIIILLSTVGFIHLRSHKRLNGKAPRCVQTVEQTLVIKVEQTTCSEKEGREKETSLHEDSNLSPVQRKLPDTISSLKKTS